MGRALELSFIALVVIIVAFAVVPWVFARSTKAKRRWGDSVQRGEIHPPPPVWVDPDEWAAEKDLDGPDGPHGRPTV